MLITLIGDKDTKLNKTLPVLKELTVISGRLECRLKLAIACSMCSNEVCAECHVNAEEEQLSLRLRKGFIGDGEGKAPQDPLRRTCKVKLVKRMVCWGRRETCSLIRAEGAKVEPEEIVRILL